MTRFLAILAALTCAAQAQTYRTVTADTNNVIRTNFTLGAAQVSGSFAISNITGLQSALDGKLATNGDAFALTNFPALLLRTNGSASGLTNFPASILQTNSSLSVFPAGLLRTNGDGSGLTNLPNADLGSATGILPLANGGTGATNASEARTALELGTAATNDATAFQPANTNLTALAGGDGSSLTNVTITDASALTNFPAELLRTNGDAAGLTNFPADLLRTNGDGSGLSNVSVDLTTVLPSYSGNDGKVLAVAAGGTNVEWTAISNTVTDGSLITNFPAYLLQTNGDASTLTNFPSELLRTNGSAANLTSFPANLLTTNGNASGLTNFPASVLQTNSDVSVFPAGLLRTNGDASGLTNLPAAGSFVSATNIGPIQIQFLPTNSPTFTTFSSSLGFTTNPIFRFNIPNGMSMLISGTNTAHASYSLGMPNNSGNTITFSNDFSFGAQISQPFTGARLRNGRMFVGTTGSTLLANPTNTMIGWRFQEDTTYAAMHNGSTYTEPFSTNGVFPTNGAFIWLWVEGDGSGNVSWYVNGQLLGTSTNGPTGDAVGQHFTISINNEAGTNFAGTQRLDIANFIYDFK